jgi:hypothetical protein
VEEIAMSDRRLEDLRARLVRMFRSDPPVQVSPLVLDRWLLTRLSRAEIELLLAAEVQYGPAAMSEWIAEVLVDAGVTTPALPLAG